MKRLIALTLASASILSLASAAHAQEFYFRHGDGSIRLANSTPTAPTPEPDLEPEPEPEEPARYPGLSMNSSSIVHAIDSNGNGLIEAGETIAASFEFENIGDADFKPADFNVSKITLYRKMSSNSYDFSHLSVPTSAISCTSSTVQPGET